MDNVNKMSMIRHERFNNLFLLKNDIFIKYFGKNKHGKELRKTSTLINRINVISESVIRDFWELYPDDPNKPGSGLQRLKGDVFEIFIECFLILMGNTPSVGVYQYKPEKKEEDLGVDGYGYGIDGKKLTVQIKFRSDPNKQLDQNDIKQFPFQSYILYGVETATNTNMLLITSCSGMYPVTKTRTFRSKIREINLDQLKNLVDDNAAFWNNFNKLINNTIRIIYGTKALSKSNVNAFLSEAEDLVVSHITREAVKEDSSDLTPIQN
jgi:hypothetical protein